MATTPVSTTNLPAVAIADEVLVNAGVDGITSTGRQSIADLATQLSGSGAIADRIATIETVVSSGAAPTYAAWSSLPAPASAGASVVVSPSDTGTHTGYAGDAPTATTAGLANAGIYRSIESPASAGVWVWTRVGDNTSVIAEASTRAAADAVLTTAVGLKVGRSEIGEDLTGTRPQMLGWLTAAGVPSNPTNTYWRWGQFTACGQGDRIDYSLYAATGMAYLLFFSADFLLVESLTTADSVATLQTGTVYAPSGAAMVVACYGHPSSPAVPDSHVPSAVLTRSAATVDGLAPGGVRDVTGDVAGPGYVSSAGAISTTDANWRRCATIEVIEGETVYFHVYAVPTLATLSWWAEGGEFIGAVTKPTSGTGIHTGSVAVPAGAVRMIASFGDPSWVAVPDAFVTSVTVMTTQAQARAKIARVFDRVVPASSSAASVESYVDLADLSAGSTGWITSTGTTSAADGNWFSTAFWPAAPGDTVSYNLWGHPDIASVAWYDGPGGALVSKVSKGTSGEGLISGTATAPSGAASVRISGGRPTAAAVPDSHVPSAVLGTSSRNVYRATAQIALDDLRFFKAPRRLILSSSSKILLYGDSRFSKDYTFAEGAFGAITGAEVYAGGYSGQTPAQVAADDHLQRIWDYHPDVIVLLLGHHTGAAGTVGTFDGSVPGERIIAEPDTSLSYSGKTFSESVDYIVRRIQGHYYNIRTRAGVTGSETEAERTALIDAVEKPVLILCTDLAQSRSDVPVQALPSSWERKRQAIAEIGRKNHVHTVDLLGGLFWDMTLEPVFAPPTDAVNNRGVYTMDGVHPNRYGHDQIAQLICGDAGLV